MKSVQVYQLMTKDERDVRAMFNPSPTGGKIFLIAVREGGESHPLSAIERQFPFLNIERLPQIVNRNYPSDTDTHMLQPAWISLKS